MPSPARAPALFVGHGSPMNALEDNPVTRSWRALGEEIGKPRAILAVSAHWETDGLRVMAGGRPRTIHDFGCSFPQALFDIQYPAPGDPALADEVSELLSAWDARTDAHGWGLDHGVWSVLRWMYPQADVPVLQLSLDRARTPEQHHAIGKALRPLRDAGVVVMGSGNIVHNLRAVNVQDPTPYPWALAFDETVKARLAARDDEAVVHWQTLSVEASLAAPDPEHFMPLLYALGAADPNEPPRIFNDEVFSSLSMTSAAFGIA